MWTLPPKFQEYRDRKRPEAEAQVGRPLTEYEHDMWCFNRRAWRCPAKHHFLLRAMEHQWGGRIMFEETVNGIKFQNYWAIRIAKDMCESPILDLMGSGSSGKTHMATCVGYTIWKSVPYHTSVYLSTTTGEGADARAWATVNQIYRDDAHRFGKMINSTRTLVIEEADEVNEENAKFRDLRNAIKCVLIPTGNEGKNVVGAISGRKNNRVIWISQPLDSNILTPVGWVKNRDLEIGQEIIGSNGNTFYISALHPITTQKVYRLTFTDGSQAESSGEHLWTLRHDTSLYSAEKYARTGKGYFPGEKTVTASLSEFAKNLKKPTGLPRWSLPRPAISNFNANYHLPLSPYLVGALLGDGHIKKGFSDFYNTEEDIIEQVRSELPEGCDMPAVRKDKGQYHIRGIYGPGQLRFNAVVRGLKEIGIYGRGSEDKFIPQQYLWASVSERIALLQGLMDTDGTVLKSTNRYTSISPQLRKDVIHLVRSLGGYARECLPFTVVFNLPDIDCFRSIRKLRRASPCPYEPRRRALVSVEEIGEKEVRCITTTAPDGLYITDDFVPTHNCDEFSHMDMGVLKGRVNLFTNAAAGGWAQFVGCCNGPHDGSVSFIDCEPADGWTSVNKDEHWRWETKSGVCLYFNGDKSPNMQVPRGTRAPFPKLVDWEVRDLILKNCWNDENSPEFWTQFFGFPPSVQIADTVLTKAFMTNNGAFGSAEWEGSPRKVIAGLDLGFRQGGDPCILHAGKIGKDVRAKTILELEGDGVVLNPSAASKEAFEAQIAKKVVGECEKRDCHDLALDVTGDGGIMLQAIEKEARARGYALNCLAVSFSGAPEDKIVIPGEKRTAKVMFDRMVSQIWGQSRVCVGNGVIRGLGEKGKATEQLCQRKFMTDEKKRFSVESKKLMKERLKRSPDQGDACCLCIFLALRHGLSGADVPKPPPKPPVPAVGAAPSRYAGHAQQRRGYTGFR